MQSALQEAMSGDLMFGELDERDLEAIFNKHFRDRMGEMERGHMEVYSKNLRPYDKANGEVLEISRLLTANQKVRKKRKNRKISMSCPTKYQNRRLLLGAKCVVYAPRLWVF